MIPFEEIPFPTKPADRRGYEIFKSELWHSGQVCSNCFSHIRNIGPEIERWMGASYQIINSFYERTELGSQEYTQWDDNVRYGTCFCVECGSDCTGDHRSMGHDDLIPIVRNIYVYTRRCTDYDLDRFRLAREFSDLMSIRDSSGYQTEVLAIAFARALIENQPQADQRATAD